MNCPNCESSMETDRVQVDWACPNCGLCGPASVLGEFAALTAELERVTAERDAARQPATVLAETERLLRLIDFDTYLEVTLWEGGGCAIDSKLGARSSKHPLAEAYATVMQENPAAPERAAELAQDDAAALAALRESLNEVP